MGIRERFFSPLVISSMVLYLAVIIPSVVYTQEVPDIPEIQEIDDYQDDYDIPDIIDTGEELPVIPAVQVLSPDQNRILMEIRTSTLSELASWSRELGLPEGGTSGDLARRLRDYFGLGDQPDTDDSGNRRIITIESARSTEYFKIEAVDEEYARLSGEVRLSLKDGDAIHSIHAWNVLFNRTRNILTASGGVMYRKEEGDTVETFRGESITVDLDNWSSIFLGGVSERTLQSDNTAYLFSGTVISRDEEDVTILNRAVISNAGSDESLWSLNATRVWLLPGSDFAIFNAVLKIGEIPVLYIPFFYYPSDEIVFHPVIGSRTREGSYVQTTTYILGRPQTDSASQSSLTRILGSSNDMEKVREGMFLRSTGRRAVDPGQTSLIAMVDFYTNLGAFLGTELRLPSRSVFGPISLDIGFGLTRTIAQVGSVYTPFFPDYDGGTDWNWSNLFSMNVPFRYRFETSSSISGRYGSFSWNLPFYSDPLVNSDFIANRSTDMDWVNMLQQGAAVDLQESSAQSHQGSYQWTFHGTINPRFPSMAPYISSINIGSISSSISFASIDGRVRNNIQNNDIRFWSPSIFFYAPDAATLYSISASVSGTPLSLGAAATQPIINREEIPLPDIISNIGTPRSPFTEEREEEETQQRDPADTLVPPVLNQRFDLPRRSGFMRASVNYSFTPTSASTLYFDTHKWNEFGDVNWGDIASIISNFSGNASTTMSMNFGENFITNTLTYSGTGTWRQYSYLNEEAGLFLDSNGDPDPARVAAAKLREYNSSNFSTSFSLSTSVRPFSRHPVFSATSMQHSLSGLALRSHFIGTGDEPEWEIIYGSWDKDKITAHTFTGTLSAMVWEQTQTLSVSSELPPRDSALSWRTNLRIWITVTDANMRILHPGDASKRKLEPFNLTETINFAPYGSLTQRLTLDTELVELTSLNTQLNLPLWGLSMSYTASRIEGWKWDTDSNRWILRGEEPTLRSTLFNINFSKNFNWRDMWNDRMNISINTASQLRFDLQRYTESLLTFSLGFTLGIDRMLSLSFSTNMENSSIYRYFRNWPMFRDAEIDVGEGRQNNLFLDLYDSFRFGNREARERSGFKTRGFQISIVHNLGDWDATLNWSMRPYRPNPRSPVEMNNEVSFMLQWKPITEIKTDLHYNRNLDPEWQFR